jgi:uncharacterized membrane protein YtjA (UPF0391 family)
MREFYPVFLFTKCLTQRVFYILTLEIIMLRAAIAFFVLGVIAILLGANGVGGLSLDIGKILLFVFLILSIISFVASLVSGRKLINHHR